MSDFDSQEKYNFIFNQIVENDDDFVGSMAYVLYKRNKIEFIEQYKSTHGGKEPELVELREWQKSECVKSKLDNYKKLAQQKTAEFVNSLQSDKEKQLNKLRSDLTSKERSIKERERLANEKDKDIKKRNQYCHVKPKGQYWIGVSQSLVASFIFIVICLVVIVYLSGNADFILWLQKILGTK